MARNVAKDGSDQQGVHIIAAFGRSNAERNLHRWAAPALPVQPFSVKLPTLAETAFGMVEESVSISLPHEMMAGICSALCLSK